MDQSTFALAEEVAAKIATLKDSTEYGQQAIASCITLVDLLGKFLAASAQAKTAEDQAVFQKRWEAFKSELKNRIGTVPAALRPYIAEVVKTLTE